MLKVVLVILFGVSSNPFHARMNDRQDIACASYLRHQLAILQTYLDRVDDNRQYIVKSDFGPGSYQCQV